MSPDSQMLDLEQPRRAPGFVSARRRMSEHQAFAAESLDCAESVAKFAASFERNEFNPQARRNRRHALGPRSRRIRCIEGNEPRVAPIAAVLDGDTGFLKTSAPAPDFTVELLAAREIEPRRRRDFKTAATPHSLAVPKCADAIVFFGAVPADYRRPAEPVLRVIRAERHFVFVHTREINQKCALLAIKK